MNNQTTTNTPESVRQATVQSMLRVGDEFHMGPIACKVTAIDSFGTTPHYGFTYYNNDGDFHSGWMPVLFVDQFTGHQMRG